jgi:hypothetical protein
VSGHEGERLSGYLDGELAPDERREVEAHIAACPACTALLAALTAVDSVATSLPAEAPEGYFDAFPSRVVARLGPASRAPVPARRLPVWTWAAAAALLLAVVAPLTLRRVPAVSAPTATPAPAELPPASPPAEPTGVRDSSVAPDATSVPAAHVPPALAPRPATARPAAPAAQAVADGRLPAEKSTRPDVMSEGAAPPPPPRLPAEQDALARPTMEAPADSGEREEATRATNETFVAPAGAGLPARRAPGAAAAPVARSVRPDEASAGALSAPRPESSFEQLEASRPRAAAEWRRLRDAWIGFASSHPDDPRADEARVRAIEAGREAWLAGRAADDEASFLRDARVYLARPDAVQKPRVERLLAEPGRTR